MEHGCRISTQGFLTETNHVAHHVAAVRETILWPPKSGLHDERVGGSWFADLGGQAGAQFEITRVENRFTLALHE